MTIEIVVEGVRVIGEITHHTASDMTVVLVEPYSGLHRDLHLMNLARSAPGLRHGLLSPYGEVRAHELLRELYETAIALYEHTPLLDLIGPYVERVQKIEMTEVEYQRRRQVLRRQLRDRIIDNDQHSVMQQGLCRERRDRDAHVASIIGEFIAAHVPSATARSLQNQVWNSLVAMLGGVR